MKPAQLARASAAAGLALAAMPASAASIQAYTGWVEPDTSGFDGATVGGVRLGAELADVGFFELDGELEAATDLDEGDTATGDWGYRSVGAFLTARSAGALYFLGRVGVTDQEIDPSDGEAVSDTREAIGLGVGASVGVAQFEVLAQRHAETDELDAVDSVTAAVRFSW